MKKVLSVITLLLASIWGYAQEASNWSALFAAQKHYVATVMAPDRRAAYMAQIHMAHIAHAKVLAEIKKTYPAVNFNGNWNMLEEFLPGGDLTGVIWPDGPSEPYYEFQYATDQKLTVHQRTLAQLSDTTETIVSTFQNWDNVTFARQGSALGAPRGRPFFMASRISGDIRQIICFYYP
ncbi:hypothetical protein A4H97_29675 [Niastella yeongjuensis]|uniref:Uncharacterized protein n=1 Tax=Niastella yeongjuensis TaxID=354355 RepID=A0A1V9EPF4_9BACT|nr:hypothetical protein [Niastella yeongjuensis]OQP48010.1 hypothetical protein A4H97_29675 [Niastella yeongjuensis]SEO23400.1 hypothetical protein SAMN05660816_02334 [Niastella yeongjuensis]